MTLKALSGRNALTTVHALVHVSKGVAVSRDTFDDAGRQQVLRRGAIKDPIVFVCEIGETCAFAHVQANGRFFDIDVKIVFFHWDNFPGLRTKLGPDMFQLQSRRPYPASPE
jgi:hypothetical protein